MSYPENDMTSKEEAHLYALACDAICRTLWADQYGIKEDDGLMHTSSEARRVAIAVFKAIGL